MLCFAYEGVLLFGVVMIAGLLWSVATQQRHALEGQTAMQAFLFVVLGGYFVGFWSHRGQTLAMQTWRIRLVSADGGPVRPLRAALRYLMAWLWFLPALALVHFSGLRGNGATFAVVLAGVAAYAALARLHPSRQFLHDLACGTRLIRWDPPRPER
jgi:uncharacterized RDD family membrane protein YckC